MEGTQETSTTRILARSLAQEMTESEVNQVSGGACRTEMRITYQGGQPDAEAVLICG